MGNFRSNNRNGSFGGNRDRSGSRGSFGGRDSGRGGFGGGGRRSFGGRSSGGFRRDGPAQMHDAICDKCKKACQVPFRPSGDKPVYCSDCFGKSESSREFSRDAPSSNSHGPTRQSSSPGISAEQFNKLNTKLDKIISILEELEIIDGEEDSEEIIDEESEDNDETEDLEDDEESDDEESEDESDDVAKTK